MAQIANKSKLSKRGLTQKTKSGSNTESELIVGKRGDKEIRRLPEILLKQRTTISRF